MKRRFYDYEVGQQIMVKTVDPSKLGERSVGRHVVTQVHVNGNATIEKAPHVFEGINIRQILPCWLLRQM